MRAPIRYAVDPSGPTRLAGSVDQVPYRLINFNPTAGVVWLSDNAGIQVGQGTPLNPGTSFLWERPGELYAIAEAPAEIILTTELTDWQPDPAAIAVAILNSGLLLVDQPELIFSAVVGGGVSSPVVDISRFQSVVIGSTLTASAALYDELLIKFWDDNPPNLGFERSIQFSQLNAIWTASMPALMKYLRFEPSNSTYNVFVVGSHRAVEGLEQKITAVPGSLGFGFDTDFYFNTAAPLVGGTTIEFFLPPWFGEIELDVSIASAAAPVGSSGLYIGKRNPITGGFNNIRLTPISFVSGTLYAATTRIGSAGDSLRVRVSNLGAPGPGDWSNFVVRATPISGFGAVT